MKKVVVFVGMIVLGILLTSCVSGQDYVTQQRENVFSAVEENEDLWRESVSILKELPSETEFVSHTDQRKPMDVEIPEGVYRAERSRWTPTSPYESYTYEMIYNETLYRLFKLDVVDRISVKENCIDYFCFGTGFVTSMGYYGVYYSEEDIPLKIFNMYEKEGDDLTEMDDGWGWKDSDSEKYYYTEQICENFYYYVALY